MKSIYVFFILCVSCFLFLAACQPPPKPFQPSDENAEIITADTQGELSSDDIAKMINKAATLEVQKLEFSSVNFNAFYVYTNKGSRSNHYVPSGFMPNGKCVKMNDKWMENCYSEKSCIRIDYDLECSTQDQNWAGVYWLNPANNWGHKKGGFNLVGAKKLTFWARGKNGGETIQEFLMGGINGNYPDSDSASIGPVILSQEWRKYTIDLRGKNLSYISGGFAWTTNVDVNNEECVFYLDDVRYE